MKYKLLKTEKADESIRNILRFVERNFDTETALRIIDELERSAELLSENPYGGLQPKDRVLRHRGYRIMITQKEVIIYKINEEKREVTIHLVADQRQDYVRLLK